jgi:2-polyprenyl-3-methyl-5-hydroxy-6-metoxy-1,4-benzoquinol methylase
MIYTGERLVPDSFSIDDRIMVEHLDRYRFASHLIMDWKDRPKKLKVLDAPCGVGYGAALLAEQTLGNVFGFDNDEQTILYARDRYGAVPNLHFLTVDLDEYGIAENTYDVAVCFEGIEHVKDQVVVAKKLCQTVRHPGMIIVSTPRRGGPGAGSEFHTQELLRDELYELFWPHLTNIQMYGQDLRVGDQNPDGNARYYVLVGTK